MGKTTYTTHELTGKHLVDPAKDKRIGKVRRFVFHPTQKRLLGITVKRPDAALMFHRKDVFVPLSCFTFVDGEVVLTGELYTADKSVEKAIHEKWDDCVLWIGMPVVTESDKTLGFVGNVRFNNTTGEVVWLTTENGVANDVLLGKYKIPSDMIRGFKRGKDDRLSHAYENYNDSEPEDRGRILVDDAVLDASMQGGVAAAAGKASVVVAEKAKREGKKAKTVVDEKMRKAKPTMDKAARTAGKAIDEGAFALGKQLGKTTGMFSAFKDELKSALADDDEKNE